MHNYYAKKLSCKTIIIENNHARHFLCKTTTKKDNCHTRQLSCMTIIKHYNCHTRQLSSKTIIMPDNYHSTRWKYSCKLAILETRTRTTCWPFSIQGEAFLKDTNLLISVKTKLPISVNLSVDKYISQFHDFSQDEVCCSWEVPICTPQKIWWVNISFFTFLWAVLFTDKNCG